ncbi:MAG: c-type cytochrome [Sphingobacteriales bacterium]|nr:c-type cytochrome [Sphingobacteriales bacterium]
MKRRSGLGIGLLTIMYGLFFNPAVGNAQMDAAGNKVNAGLKIPEGFNANILIDNLGQTRHLLITPQNDIYVRLAKLHDGKGTIVLHESNGKAVIKSTFGNFTGTGVYMRNGYLYTSSNTEIYRYKLDEQNEVINPEAPEVVVKGLVDRWQHNTKSIMMDNEGNLFIPVGAPSNSCQINDRVVGSLGMAGCPLLDSAGGVWQFKADKLNQTYSDGVRYATGLRNVVAVDWNTQTNQLYVMQHGRDQLNNMFPQYYTFKQSAELPAECMYALKKGDNAGWPYIYYDGFQKKKMLAPEYGGDGKKEGAAEFLEPTASYPAHMAPNGLLFYTGNQFPAKYKNGAFIAFHGSWNRSPEPQAGYFVVFQPFKDGKPAGDWEVFADGFSGSPEKTASGRADRRPCGLAQSADGSLYISDDVKGAIFKITYSGEFTSNKTEVQTGMKSIISSTKVTPNMAGNSKTPPAIKKTTAPAKLNLSAGKALYVQNCVACHQVDGGGVQNLNPPLIKTSYVLGDKTKLINVLLNGLNQVEVDGEKYSNVMPPFSHLSDKQIADVLSYVRNNFGNKASLLTEKEVSTARAKK